MFGECTSLESITIPAGVTSIGSGAFGFCTSLKTVTFAPGSQLQTINNFVFVGCSSLTSITIPAGVTSIGFNAFEGCTSLTSITIGNITDANFQGSSDIFGTTRFERFRTYYTNRPYGSRAGTYTWNGTAWTGP